MKVLRYYTSLALTMVLLMLLVGCSKHSAATSNSETSSHSRGQIYLYGEQHGVEQIMDKEFELWCEYYENKNLRHLFVELPYYTAEFLNVWMQSDSDDILDELMMIGMVQRRIILILKNFIGI